MLGQRLQLARERAVRLAVHFDDARAQLFEQARNCDAADARAAVDGNAQLAPADALGIDAIETEHACDVPLERCALLALRSELLVAHPARMRCFHALAQRPASRFVEELAERREELECVPRRRIVAGREAE